MASLQELENGLVKADAAGNADDARVFANEIRRMRSEAAPVAAESRDADGGLVLSMSHQDAASPPPGMLASVGAGIGSGVGQVAMGAQHYLGKGLGAVGLDSAGQWLVDDAATGRANMKAEVQPYKDANPIATGGGEIAGNIAATGPVGRVLSSVVGLGARAAPAVINPLMQAISSSGFRAGGLTGARGLATRSAGGAITGGASAGLVDPEQAGTGALVGAALPVALQGLQRVGTAMGRTIHGPDIPDQTLRAALAAREAGYVLPPTQVNPNLLNRGLEGVAGKISTSQNASAANQVVTNSLARRAVGLPEGVDITVDALQGIRRQAGQAYEAIRGIGQVQTDDALTAALNGIEGQYRGAARSFPGLANDDVANLVASLRRPEFDAGDAIDATRILREMADGAFRNGETGLGNTARQASGALEDALERAVANTGNAQAVDDLVAARRQIARTYTVEGALNRETGTVDARKLAAELRKGVPLTDELRQAAGMASAFPKAAQVPEMMGSLPGISPLDVFSSTALGVSTGNPLAGLLPLARPAARAAALSGPIQNRLVQIAPPAGQRPLIPQGARNALSELLYQSAPVLSTSR